MERFMNKNPEPTKKLGDILMEKMTEKRTEIETQLSDAGTSNSKLLWKRLSLNTPFKNSSLAATLFPIWLERVKRPISHFLAESVQCTSCPFLLLVYT